MAVTSFADGRGGFARAVPFDQLLAAVEEVGAGAAIAKLFIAVDGS